MSAQPRITEEDQISILAKSKAGVPRAVIADEYQIGVSYLDKLLMALREQGGVILTTPRRCPKCRHLVLLWPCLKDRLLAEKEAREPQPKSKNSGAFLGEAPEADIYLGRGEDLDRGPGGVGRSGFAKRLTGDLAAVAPGGGPGGTAVARVDRPVQRRPTDGPRRRRMSKGKSKMQQGFLEFLIEV